MNKINKNLSFIFIFLVAVFTVSCEKFLEEEIVDQITVDYIYTSPEGLEVGVNALYSLMRSYNAPSGAESRLKSNIFFMAGTDLGQTRTWHRPYGPNHTASAFVSNKWVDGYEIIDRCNAIITNARNVEMIEADKNRVVAEAKIIRGELYLDLYRMYENILLDTIATTPENANDSIIYKPAKKEDIFKLIDEDLDFAINNLEYGAEYGRYSKSVARHLKGKSAMWQENWDEAAKQFDKIIDESGHRLVNLSDVFGQNLDHSETMFVYTRDELLGGGDHLAGGAGSWFGSVFTNRLYEDSHGYFINKVEHGGQALAWSVPNAYLKSLYDKENDKRYTTYYYPETYIANNPNSDRFGEEIMPEEFDDNFRRYHFSLKKFYDEEKGAMTNDSWKDHMYYRFAETYLLGSEAHWRLGNNDKALEYINIIRRRAYTGVAYSADDTYDFKEYSLDNYLDESARELAFEKNRWFLLKRLGLLVERQNLHYRYGSNSSNLVPEPMAPHMVNCPIPQSQIDLMGTFPQNEGY